VTEENDKPAITAATRTQGRLTFQYYGLRRHWTWTLSHKTRDLVSAMRGAWGSDVDIVTMLGAGPRAPYQDWQRFDSTYEVVDLGRNRKKAEEIIAELKREASAEKDLRAHVARDLAHETRESVEGFVQRCKDLQESVGQSISRRGLLWTAYEKDLNSVATTDFQREWAEKLLKEKPEGPLISALRMALAEAKKELLAGDTVGRKTWNAKDVEHAIAATKGCALVAWVGKLSDWIREWMSWEEAKQRVSDRKLGVLANRIIEKTGEIS